MRWLRSIIIVLAVLQAGWMTFDGARALIVGDYVTATSGEYAGQLGPWATELLCAFLAPSASRR
ncbi:MAG: hypothetical protein ACRD8U_04645 [Pyrinomonadaceae bacterium]